METIHVSQLRDSLNLSAPSENVYVHFSLQTDLIFETIDIKSNSYLLS